MGKTLSEYEKEGGCEGCQFYEKFEGNKVCTFNWMEETDDWEMSKNCDELE